MISQTFKQEVQHLRENKCLPGPKILQIEITNVCHLHCPQCYKPPVSQLKSMCFDDFKKHVDAAADVGVKEISLLGGEPFENKDIFQMIEYGISKDIEIMTVTNGFYINETTLNQLRKFTKGFTLLISLNGSTESINNLSRGGYKLSVNAALRAHEANVQFGINWVARHDNAFDFENTVNLSRKLGANFINVVANKLTGNAQVESPLTYEDYQYIIKVFEKEKDSHFISIQKCFDLLISRATKEPRSILSGCQAGISVAAITLDNQYMPCLHLMYPEKHGSLAEYWKSSKILTKLRNKDKINSGYCAGCKYASNCKYCRAMSNASHADFNAGLENCVLRECQYDFVKI